MVIEDILVICGSLTSAVCAPRFCRAEGKLGFNGWLLILGNCVKLADSTAGKVSVV